MLKRRTDSELILSEYDEQFHEFHVKKRCQRKLNQEIQHSTPLGSSVYQNNQDLHIPRDHTTNHETLMISLPHSDLCTHSLLYVMGQLTSPDKQKLVHKLMDQEYKEKRLLFSSLIIARISCHIKSEDIGLDLLYRIMHSVEDCERLWNIFFNLLKDAALSSIPRTDPAMAAMNCMSMTDSNTEMMNTLPYSHTSPTSSMTTLSSSLQQQENMNNFIQTEAFHQFGVQLFQSLVKFSVLLHLRPHLPRSAYDILHLPQSFSL